MRYFKIYNKNVTQSRPFKELTEDQFLADIADYALDRTKDDSRTVLDYNRKNA